MRFCTVSYFCLALAAPLTASFITGTSPSSNTANWSAAIRIYDPIPATNLISEGTGTIFDARVIGDVLQFGIVTAAHVVDASQTSLYFGFSNGGVTEGVITPDSLLVATGGGTGAADLAYIGMSFHLDTIGDPLLKSLVQSIQPATLAAANASPSAPFAFTSYGYGLSTEINATGTNSQFAYVYDPQQPSLSYGVERSFTNSITGYQNGFAISDGSTGKSYVSNIETYTLTSTPGSGASLPGDSGSGVFVNGNLQGVIEFGPNHAFVANGMNYSGYAYGDTFGAVRLTSSYLGWLQAQNQVFMTPEPGTMALAGLALLALRKVQKHRR